jgi:hypothetical protein
MSNEFFSAEERAEILSACFKKMARLEAVGGSFEEATGSEEQRLRIELDALAEDVKELWMRYRKRLPVLDLSCCPFTGEVWRHSIDHYGIDGFWWREEKPIRPLVEPFGGAYFCFSGALALSEPVESAPFLCTPGPEIPFVVPRILQGNAKAVISHIPIGGHDGYCVVYFADEPMTDIERTDDWGINYAHYLEDGRWRISEAFDIEEDYDFDVARWIDSGKLLWIDKGDSSLELRTGTNGCPYIGLAGRNRILYIEDGEVWYEP